MEQVFQTNNYKIDNLLKELNFTSIFNNQSDGVITPDEDNENQFPDFPTIKSPIQHSFKSNLSTQADKPGCILEIVLCIAVQKY